MNTILATDSYKLNHWNQYPPGTEAVYSYMESREGAKWPYTVFFGLQYLLERYLEGVVVRTEDLTPALQLAEKHFGRTGLFNYKGWAHVVNDHGGRLPLRIHAVLEGTVVPTGEVMMTVENTCPRCFWLTNAMESLLTHLWYPSTVATLSRTTKEMIGDFLDEQEAGREGLPFMLHDFGYRGASSHESAAIGGAAHLVNFVGTDTLPAMECAMEHYSANLDDLAFSVPATEHSVMTAGGEEEEALIVSRLLTMYPEGILSVVADSFDIYRFVDRVCGLFKDRILARDGVFVVRPDSVTAEDPTPAQLVLTIVDMLWDEFGGTLTPKGYKVLDPHVRVLWGDGIDQDGIREILQALHDGGFAASNMVFGMGGGLLQKVNRDTQRFAFKCSAIKRRGAWWPVSKRTPNKTSKAGRFDDADVRPLVFENGTILRRSPFGAIRGRAALRESVAAG